MFRKICLLVAALLLVATAANAASRGGLMRGRGSAIPTIVASTSPQILTAMSSLASTGGVVLCAPGNYVFLWILDRHPSAPITLRSQDPNNPCVFTDGIRIQQSDYFGFDNLNVIVKTSANPTVNPFGFYIHNDVGQPMPHDILIQNSRIYGTLANADNGVGTPILLSRAYNITVLNNELYWGANLFTFGDCDNILIQYNYLHHWRSDGINYSRSNHVYIRGNVWRYNRKAVGDHSDPIQMDTGGGAVAYGDIEWSGNVVAMQPDSTIAPTSSGYFSSNLTGIAWFNVAIFGNATIGAPNNPIRLGKSVTSYASDNLAVPWQDPSPLNAWSTFSYPVSIDDSNSPVLQFNIAESVSAGGVTTGTPITTPNTIIAKQPFGDYTLFKTWMVGRTNLNPNILVLMADLL